MNLQSGVNSGFGTKQGQDPVSTHTSPPITHSNCLLQFEQSPLRSTVEENEIVAQPLELYKLEHGGIRTVGTGAVNRQQRPPTLALVPVNGHHLPMKPSHLTLPRATRIGGGAVQSLPAILKELGIQRPLIVTGPNLGRSPILRAVLDPLEEANIEVGVFKDTVSDPTDSVVEAGTRALLEGKHDGMIGFGGGSPIDTAKGIAILAANGGKISDYKVPNPIPKAGLPIVAIPTTAGTGSEVTRFTVVVDTTTDEKMLIAGASLVPQAAIVDFELTMTLPKRLTADTGIDALVHAVEAYVSKKRNPVASMYALDAMARLSANLHIAYNEPNNREARAEMMLGATHAGIAFSTSSVALVHGMSRPIGAFFHVHHGLSNAMLFPAVTQFSLSEAQTEYADCAKAMGWAKPTDSDEEAGRKLVEGLVKLNQDLEVPTLKAYGIDSDKYYGLIERMTEQALASGSPNNNPKIPSTEALQELYRAVFDRFLNA